VDNRYWFPCYDDADDKVVTETTVTFDKAYTVVSNGALIDTKNQCRQHEDLALCDERTSLSPIS
jgi:aminopeptidase N